MAAEAQATPAERAEMLMEIAMGLQQRPKAAAQIDAARGPVSSARWSSARRTSLLLGARITARKGTACRRCPDGTAPPPRGRARGLRGGHAGICSEFGRPEEVAEAEMNLGLVAAVARRVGRARITDAIAAYQRALRTFDRKRFPQGVRHPAEQSGDRLPVDAVHRRARPGCARRWPCRRSRKG